MAYEMKPDSGFLFKNDRREKDTHPHAKGTALIDGVEYWMDAWTNEDRNGNKYQSLKFKRKEERPQQGGYSDGPNNSFATDAAPDDDLPW